MLPEAAAAPPRARSEHERRQLLQGFDRRFLPPLDLAHLFVGQRVVASAEAQARSRWQHLRAALLQGDTSGAEAFFVLSLGLSELCFERSDVAGQRAVVDSAMHVLQSPHHKQVLRAQVARSALRAGDAQSAEAWLALCDVHSEDLLADTAYRFARAYIDTARGDSTSVIRVLGSGADVPFSDAFAAECTVLCAHAWERTGQIAVAVDALIAAPRGLGPLTQERMQRFIDRHAQWQLCRASAPEARNRGSKMDPTPPEGSTVGTTILAVLGIYSLLWAVSGVVVPIVLFAVVGDLEDLGGFGLSVVSGGAIALVMLLVIGPVRRNRRRQALRRGGELRNALIVDSRLLGTDGDGDSVIALQLLITSLDHPAYYATEKTAVQTTMLSNFERGKMLLARVQPNNPTELVLEVL